MLAAAVCSEPAGHGLSVARSSQDFLMATVDRGCRSMHPDGIALLLEDGPQYHYSGGKPLGAQGTPLPCGQLKVLADLVSSSGEVVIASDVAADERIPGESRAGPIAAALLVPVGGPEPLAVLAVYLFRPRIFAASEIALIESLADMLGTALRHAGEANSLRERLEEECRVSAAARAAEERLRQALSAGEVYAWEWNCVDDTRVHSDSCVEVLKMPSGRLPTTGEAWLERIHPEDRERYLELLRTLTRVSGRQAITYRYLRADGGVVWLQEECRAELDGQGRLRRVVGLARDVTARRRVEELQRLLMREFDHRARNMLATIQAMISLTARTQSDIHQFVAAVQSRIRSMARAHELIAGSRWTGARLRDIVSDELAPYVEGRSDAASIIGADEMLTPGATMAVAMAIHELTTNAAKYGALSVAEGKIDIRFLRDPDGSLLIEWRESGGPRVSPPTHRGFGSLLIEGSIRAEVGGTAEVRYLPEGVRCTITIPSAHIVASQDAEHGDRVAEPGTDSGNGASGTILVVEDSSAAQFDTPRRLSSFGYRVLVAGSVDDAARLAAQEPLAGAIVDINIGEKDVFPVVDILAARDLPIAFMTGYALLNLPGQYRGIPVLTRPLRRETVHHALSRSIQPSSQDA
jgi:two-component sensor histidine kinase